MDGKNSYGVFNSFSDFRSIKNIKNFIIIFLLLVNLNFSQTTDLEVDTIINEFEMIKNSNKKTNEINKLAKLFDNHIEVEDKKDNKISFANESPKDAINKDLKQEKVLIQVKKEKTSENINNAIEETQAFLKNNGYAFKQTDQKELDKEDYSSAKKSNSYRINNLNRINRYTNMDKENSENKNLFDLSPDNLPRMTPPLKKLTKANEEIIPVQEIKSDSVYISYKNGNIFNRLDAKNLINNEDIWCSSGNHGVKDEIKIKFIFDDNYRMHALWLYWAFAPGEFRIQYSNDDSNYSDIFANGFRLTEQNSSIMWWKKIISNPITRWQHRSFDERLELENPVFAKYVLISMRVPVNKYFAIYKIEFYKKLKTVAMIKSKASGKYNCLSIINGEKNNGNSPVISSSCLDNISFGDNRDLFVINSNNLITTFNSGFCLTSPTVDKVEIADCAEAEEYKDDRNKWIFEFKGLIRSKKNPETCLSIVDDSYRNYIESEALKAQASSTLNDNMHPAQRAIDYFDFENYWASAPSVNNVIFQVLLIKYSAIVKKIEIAWKFPAKKFTVYGLLANGFWKVLQKFTDNSESNNLIYVLNYDIKGVKIVMIESSSKIEGQNIYGISNIYLKIQGNFIIRQSCDTLLDRINKWEIIDINETDIVKNLEMKNKFVDLYKIELKLEGITKTFESIPSRLIDVTEKSIKINEELKKLNSEMEISKYKLTTFDGLLKENLELNKNILGENKYYPALSCVYIRKAFPHKRSGFYWIKNECFPEPLKMYCDFVPEHNKVFDYYLVYDKEKYSKKSDEEFIKRQKELKNETASQSNSIEIQANKKNFNLQNTSLKENLKVDYFDLRKMCTDLGLEPIEITEIRALDVINYLIDYYGVSLGNEKEFFGVPIGVDYECILSLTRENKGSENNCKEKFKSLSSNKSIEINNILKEFMLKENAKNENSISALLNGNSDKVDKSSTSEENEDGKSKKAGNETLKYLDYYEFFGFTTFNKFQKFSSIDTKVNTIVCSTLKKNTQKNQSAVELKCESNLRDLEDEISLKSKKGKNENLRVFNQEISVLCPSNCAKFYNSLVYGTDVYTDNSSICRAAIHAGILKNVEGGIALVVPFRGMDYYTASNQFYIESLDFADKWMRSFKIKKFTPDCAKDIIIDLEDGGVNKNVVSLKNIFANQAKENIKSMTENKDEPLVNKVKINANINNDKSLVNGAKPVESALNFDKISSLKKTDLNKNGKKRMQSFEDLFESNLELDINQSNNNRNQNKNSNFNFAEKNTNNFDEYPIASFISLEETIASAFLSNLNTDEENYSNRSKISIPSQEKNNPNLEILIKFMEYLKKNKKLISNNNKSEREAGDSSQSISNSATISNINKNENFLKSNTLEKSSSTAGESHLNSTRNKQRDSENNHLRMKETSNLLSSKKNQLLNIDSAINRLAKNESEESKKLEERKIKKAEETNEAQQKKDLEKDDPSLKMSTDIAMIQINEYIKFLRKQIQDVLNFSEEFKKFVSQISSKIYVLNNDKERGLIHQNTIFKAYLNKISAIKKILNSLESLSQIRIKRSEFSIFLLKKKIGLLIQRDNFYEDYTNKNIFINFEIFNGKNAKGFSTWNYYQLNSKGHNWVIQQKSESEDELIGSQLILQNRDFYDFELRFTVNINSDGTFGVAFRHKDQFNFYVLEISRKDKGFKRLRKFVNGAPTLLAFKSDGGYLPNKWITFKILCTNSNIKVFITQEEMQNMENSVISRNLEMIFNVNDREFMHGTVAFASHAIANLMLDDISIKQLACTDFLSYSSKKIDVLTDSCDKYSETFLHIYSYWETIDPDKSRGGPSLWTSLTNFDNRPRLIGQLSEIYGLDENEEGSIFLLKSKICEKGFFKVKGKIPLEAKDLDEYEKEKVKKAKRAFGAVFKYKDNNNFYLLEIFNDSLVRFRKKVQGKYTLISQNPLLGFEYNTWFKLLIFIKNNHFNFRFYKNSNKPTFDELFPNDLIDDDLKFGRLGIYTYKTKAYFSDFETYKIDTNKYKLANVIMNNMYVDEHDDQKIKKAAEKFNPLSKILDAQNISISKVNEQKSTIKNKNLLVNLASNSKLKSDPNKKSAQQNADSIAKYNFILNHLNKNIPNYSWRPCLQHNSPEKKLMQCENLFISDNEISKCKNSFCPTCCNKFVDLRTNLANHRYLCVKQCNIIDNPSEKVRFWNRCITPDAHSASFYNYCDRVFKFDINGNNRCKVDMCKLCCVNVDVINPSVKKMPEMSERLLKKCNDECIKYYEKPELK